MSYNIAIHGQPVQSAQFEHRPGRAVHHVRPGETLQGIAQMYGAAPDDLIRLNSHQLGGGGAGLQPGMRLEL